MAKVTVLMSTYNGEKYLRPQIESLLGQRDVDLHIVIRDDGSKDSTIEILNEYANKYPIITVLSDINCGVSKSFDKLCRYAYDNICTDYYAFCDQDDVWDADKLITAINALKDYSSDTPNLYFSNLKMVDQNLNFLRNQYKVGEVTIGTHFALIQVFTYGCTCVFNRKGLEDFCAIPENNLCHDHWIYEICTYLGNVYYDEVGHINYRRHESNVSSIKTSGFALFKVRLHTLLYEGLDHNFDKSAKQLLFFKDRINPQHYNYIYKIAHYREHINYKYGLLFSRTYKTGNFSKDIIIKFRILINKL